MACIVRRQDEELQQPIDLLPLRQRQGATEEHRRQKATEPSVAPPGGLIGLLASRSSV